MKLLSFQPAELFLTTYKMGEAKVSKERLHELLGQGTGRIDDRSDNSWYGYLAFLNEDGDEDFVAVGCWNWYSNLDGYVSIWCKDSIHLSDWRDFLEG